MSFYLAIVGTNDFPVFELDLSQRDVKMDNPKQINQFIIHASIDNVEDIMWSSNQVYLKVVDKFEDKQISAYVTPSYAKFILLHQNKPEDSIKNFFIQLHELYAKILLNPFYKPNSLITSTVFEDRVRALVRKFF